MNFYTKHNNDLSDQKRKKETNIRAKIKEYFVLNKVLSKNEFLNFVKFIDLDEIWSTENGQKILWDKMSLYALDKKIIDYEAALCGISDIFEEEEERNEEINDINNDLSDDNDLLSDIDLQSLHNTNNSFEKEKRNIKDNNKIKEKCFDEFINSFKDKKEIIYGIKFINELFFRKYIDEDNLITIENYKNFFKINKNDILKEIKNKYIFISIPNEILKNYFFIISKDKNDKSDEIIVEKSVIKNINLIIKNNSEDKKNKIDINLNANKYRFQIKNNNEDITLKIDKLILSDKNLINCINSIYDFKQNKNLKEYIENYIINLKNSIYQEIIFKEGEYKQKINDLKNINNINSEKNACIEENKKLKKQIDLLIKENLSLSNQIEDITLKIESNKNKSKNEIMPKNRGNSKSPKIVNIEKSNIDKNKNKIVIPPLKLRDKMNFNIENKNIINAEEYDYLNNSGINNISSSKSPNKILETGKNSFNEIGTEEIAYSNIESSMNLNNITDQFLLDTTRLCKEEEPEKERNRYSLSNSSRIISNKKKDNMNNYSDISDKLSGIKRDENEDNFYDYDDIDLEIQKYNNNLTDRNNRNNAFQNNHLLDIDNIDNNYRKNNNYNKAQSFYSPINNNPLKKKVKFTNEDIFYGYINKAIKNFSDFKYLFQIHKIQKLLYRYKEKLIYDEFFSDEINVYSLNTKKKKYILLITYNSFYFLKDDESLECAFRLNHNSLESIIISTKNFNLLQLSFSGGTDLIIETYQRIEILRFLQKIIDKGKFSGNLKITSSNNFYFRKRNGNLEQIPTIQNKMFLITPNFENAQKIGVLLKYKENFFSASFQEKLIVLCSIGLIYFEENNKSPKIIPIVGTAIKFIVVQINKKLYCLKMQTINDEVHIFGSLTKREIFDWLKEIAHFKKMYYMKMKQINNNFIKKKSNKV